MKILYEKLIRDSFNWNYSYIKSMKINKGHSILEQGKKLAEQQQQQQQQQRQQKT